MPRASQDPRFTIGSPYPPADVVILHLYTGRLDIVPGLRSSIGSLARVTDALGAALGIRDITLREVEDKIPDEELLGG